MSSVYQVLRRLTGAAGAPPETGRKEGELFVNMVGSNTPEMWVFGGATGGTGPGNKGWLKVNPDPSINVVAKTIAGAADPASDGNGQPAAGAQWPWIVSAGEVPIVTHNGTAYAFTGGVGKWGSTTAGGTALTRGMFTALGASAGDPETHDWTSRSETDLGAAYTAWSAGGTNSFGSGSVFVKWKDGQTYLLISPATPTAKASYAQIATSTPDQPVKSLDWTSLAGNPATLTAAYTAWHAIDTTLNVFKPADVTLIKYGTPSKTYIVVDPTAPTNVNSYFEVSAGLPPALTFLSTMDVTTAYDPATMVGVTAGSFGIVAKDGVIVAPGGGGTAWPIENVVPGTTAVKKGDLLVWDGAKFDLLAAEMDLIAYVPLDGTGRVPGGKLSDGAVINFDTSTAAGTAGGAASQTVIDGAGGKIDNVILDAGTV